LAGFNTIYTVLTLFGRVLLVWTLDRPVYSLLESTPESAVQWKDSFSAPARL